MVEKILKNVRETDIVYDVGAHIGYYSSIFSNVTKSKEVVSLEPDFYSSNLIKRNTNEKGIVVNKFIGSKLGYNTTTLNDLSSMLNLEPSVIKMDIEGFEVEAFEVPGKIALWLEDESKGVNFGTEEGDTIGLKIFSSQNNKSFFYIPACADMTTDLADRIKDSEVVLFDGTLWENDEMATSKVGEKTGQRMGHMNNSGKNGSIQAFKDLGVKRKIFIHINTTNPILLEDSKERKIVEENGWEVSYDGMEIEI